MSSEARTTTALEGVKGSERLTDFWVVRALAGGGLTSVLFIALMVFLFETGTGRTQQVVLIFLTYLLVVIALQVFTGNSGVISFGHVGLMAIGGYTAMLMNLGVSTKASQIGNAPGFIKNAHFAFLPATLIAIVVTCLIALPFGFVFARLSGTAAAIATLAFYEIVITVIANWSTVTHGTFTLYGLDPLSNQTLFWWMIGWIAVAIVVARLFRDSGLGLSLRATSSDELVARAVGVNLPLARLAAWVLSAGIAAVAGAVYMKFLGSLAPTTFSFNPVIIVTLVMFIVGGRSVSGVIVGGTIIAFIDEVLKRFENDLGRSGIEVIGLAVIFTFMMVFRSEGLFGRWELDELAVRWWRSIRPGSPAVQEGGAVGTTDG
jgi:ABC-type branched-subunit amino acid transport system permease subunit